MATGSLLAGTTAGSAYSLDQASTGPASILGSSKACGHCLCGQSSLMRKDGRRMRDFDKLQCRVEVSDSPDRFNYPAVGPVAAISSATLLANQLPSGVSRADPILRVTITVNMPSRARSATMLPEIPVW